MASRFCLSKAQLDAYFDCICLPNDQRTFNIASYSDAQQLAYLNLLTKHQLVKIPWENLAQHYSWHHMVNVRPAFLFRKVTSNPGRGGYCFEANHLFHVVLLSLGFNAYMAGSRVYLDRATGFTGFEHIINIISIGDRRYLQDCGFGPRGPVTAMPIGDGLVQPQVDPAQSRLRWDHFPANVTQQKLWFLDYRYSQADDFAPLYCFTDFEITPTDILGLSLKPGTDRQSWFTYTVVACRYTTSGETMEQPGSAGVAALQNDIDGTILLLDKTLKWRRRGEKVVELLLTTEAERVAALQQYFGIRLSDEEEESILSTAAMIAPQV